MHQRLVKGSGKLHWLKAWGKPVTNEIQRGNWHLSYYECCVAAAIELAAELKRTKRRHER
jgi:hypothetical protein